MNSFPENRRMKLLPRRYGSLHRFYQLAAGMVLFAVPQAVLAAQAATPATPVTIIAFGDSLSAGYQLRPGEGFAPQLEAALKAKGANVRVVNAGVSGDTTAQGRARVNWVLAGLKGKPDLVILELGANDMLRGQPPATAKANLDAMITAFKGRGVRVILAGMLAQPNLGARYQTEFNGLFPALAKAQGVALYPFFMDGVAAVPGLQLGDGLHPTPKGVKIIVGRMLPLVLRELGKLPK
jgi:acyl-CoA thioesterase-1